MKYLLTIAFLCLVYSGRAQTKAIEKDTDIWTIGGDSSSSQSAIGTTYQDGRILPYYHYRTTDKMVWTFTDSVVTKRRYGRRGQLISRRVYKTLGHPFIFLDSLDVFVYCYQMENVPEIYITWYRYNEGHHTISFPTAIVQGKLDDPKSIHEIKTP